MARERGRQYLLDLARNAKPFVGEVLEDLIATIFGIEDNCKRIASDAVSNLSISWHKITDKPTVFPPSTHTHDQYLTKQYILPAATETSLGGVKDGSGVTIAPDGTLSTTYENIPGPDLVLLDPETLVVKQLTGVGSDLIALDLDFQWTHTPGLFPESLSGGRGIAAGKAYVNGIQRNAWCAQSNHGELRWSYDFWKSSQEDSTLVTRYPGSLDWVSLAFVYMAGIGKFAWVAATANESVFYCAVHEPATYETNGKIKPAAWITRTWAHDSPAQAVDIASAGNVTCYVGNDFEVGRTVDWETFSVAASMPNIPGGIATDSYGEWFAVLRDTGALWSSSADAAPGSWSAYTGFKLDGATVSAFPVSNGEQWGSIMGAYGLWVVVNYSTGPNQVAYCWSRDGINWFSYTGSLANFYSVGFDGARFYATNPASGVDPAIFQLLVSSVPVKRRMAMEDGAAIGGPVFLTDIPNASAIGTDQNGKIYDIGLNNHTDPTKGAGLVGIYGSDLRTVMDRFETNLLRYIPSTEWAGIRNGVTTYDCTPALEAAIAASVSGGGIYAPAGHYKFYTTCRIKKNVSIRGDIGLALFGGTTFYKAADVLTFDTCADGIYTATENWISAPTWEQIRFQTLQPAGQPKWTSDFIMERLCLGGGFIKCMFNGEGWGAALALERVQDKVLDSVFFRGMGEELGGKAQLYLMAPRITINPAIPFDDSVNEIRAFACHFEWNVGVGTYTNPETGATATTGRSVALMSLHRNGSNSNNTGIKFSECKFEVGTSAEFNGVANQKSAIYLDRASNFQFIEGNYNQTNRVFEGVGCRNIRIHGTVVKYDPSTAPGFFAEFTNSDVIDINVSGYVNPAIINKFQGCALVNDKSVNASEFSPVSKYASDDIARHGVNQLRNYAGRANGSIIQSITTPTKTAILSNEISFADNYGDVLLGFPAKYISRFRNGMTLRFRASASLAGHAIFASYHSYPATSRTQCDGVRTVFPIGVFFPVDIDFPWLTPVTVSLQNRNTGANTPLTLTTDYTLSGESDFAGGTVTLLVAPSADYDIIIARGIIKKNIISVIVSTSPTWYSIFIPPAILKLENVYLCLTAAPTSEVPGLYYTIHEFEPIEYAEATTTPYYPALVANLGPGQPPIAGGGYGCGWEVGSFVKAVNTSSKSPILLGWECVSSTGNGGVGSFREVYADRETSIVNTGTTSYTLPDPATQSIGAKRRYINNGTATITVTAFAGNTFAKCNQTALSLGVGESVLLEYTAKNVWSIVDGLLSMAEITYSGNVAQTINAATTTKIAAFNTNSPASINCTADQANDKITTTREAMYEIEALLSWYSGTITNFTLSIFVDNVLAGINTIEYFGATGSATTQIETLPVKVPGIRIAAGKDIDLRIAHNDAGSVIIGVVRASLSAKRIA